MAFAGAAAALVLWGLVRFTHSDASATPSAATAHGESRRGIATDATEAPPRTNPRQAARWEGADSVYAQQRFSALIAAADLAGSNIDSYEARFAAISLCHYLKDGGGNFVSLVSRVSDGNASAEALQSAGFIDGYRRKFCDLGVDSMATPYWLEYRQGLEAAARTSGDRAALRLLEIEAMAASEEAESDPVVRTEVETIFLETRSPATFMRAGTLLASGALGEWGAGDGMYLGAGQTEVMANVRQAAVVLAYCDLFQVCGAESLVSMRACIPYDCAPGITYPDVVRRGMSPTQFELARRLAEAMISTRRH
jgi:hypothetical protein